MTTTAPNILLYYFFLSVVCSLALASSHYAVGWIADGEKATDYVLQVDYDSMEVTPLFSLPFHYTNEFGSAYDAAHNIIFLMATTGANTFGFYSIDINTNTTTTYNVPAAVLPFESSLRWISTTPDVVYIFSWKAAYTFSFADSTFQEFLNFSTVFQNVIPENYQSPTPFYFDTTSSIIYCYFVYEDANNKEQMARIGVNMNGEIEEKESISCIPGQLPFFDSSNNNTYSILQITTPDELYDFVQVTTQDSNCTYSKTLVASPRQVESYFWDASNNRMLLGIFDFTQNIPPTFMTCMYCCHE